MIEKTSQFTLDDINQQKCSFMILLFVCRKEGRSHHKKNHHFCSKAISKASPATPRSGTICWVLYSGKSWQKAPAGGQWTKKQGVPTLRILFMNFDFCKF